MQQPRIGATAFALTRIEEVRANRRSPDAGIRVAVTGRAEGHFVYDMQLVPSGGEHPGDLVVEGPGGVVFHVPLAREVAIPWILPELGNRDIRRLAADPTASPTYDEVDMTGPTALVFGNEAWGLAEEVAAAVDERASIPMRASAESLNVGIAAAVFLFEAVRQRRRR